MAEAPSSPFILYRAQNKIIWDSSPKESLGGHIPSIRDSVFTLHDGLSEAELKHHGTPQEYVQCLCPLP